MDASVDRLATPAWTLLARAAGGPRELGRKAVRLARALAGWLDGGALEDRLERLRRLGHIAEAPSRLQLLLGSIDMVRFWISPAAADYYAQLGISYGFHQVLRFLDEPTTVIDPVGLLSSRDSIIAHLLQVVHANPRYDLQLLDSHEDGLDALERQARLLVAGTHPRQRAIAAVVEEADYPGRLLGFISAYRADPAAPAPLRDNIAADPALRVLERTFGSLPPAMAYFASLPDTWAGAVKHVLTVRAFPGPPSVAQTAEPDSL